MVGKKITSLTSINAKTTTFQLMRNVFHQCLWQDQGGGDGRCEKWIKSSIQIAYIINWQQSICSVRKTLSPWMASYLNIFSIQLIEFLVRVAKMYIFFQDTYDLTFDLFLLIGMRYLVTTKLLVSTEIQSTICMHQLQCAIIM